MGAVPKHKISTHRRGRRRAVIRLKAKQTLACKSCRQLKLPHRACPHCGAVK